MNQTLESQIAHLIFQFKKGAGLGIGGGTTENNASINITELHFMHAIVDNTENPENNVSMSDIREFLSVTKGAISQMLASLEKKGYINRDIDRNNRRNLIVTLTSEGRKVLESRYEEHSKRLQKVINRLGEEDAKQLLRIFNRMIDITKELNSESEAMKR